MLPIQTPLGTQQCLMTQACYRPTSHIWTPNIVKLVYKDHLGDEVSVVVIDRWPCKEDLRITTKTVNSDIWSLYKGSIIFQLITLDTDKNKFACIFVRNKKLCCDKTTYYK